MYFTEAAFIDQKTLKTVILWYINKKKEIIKIKF